MQILPFLSASSFLLLRSSTTAYPSDVSPSSTQISSRATSLEQCQQEQRATDPSCWNTLKIAEHLTNWRRTMPICRPNGNGVDCCISTEPFSTCYIRHALNAAGYACDTLNGNFCSASVLRDSGEQNLLLRARQRYVITAVYEIRSFLQSYSKAFKVQDSPSPAALSSGLPVPLLLGLSVAKTTARNTTDLHPLANRWSVAIQAAPAVREILFPANATSNAQPLDLSTVNGTDAVSSYLEAALKLIVSDVDVFLRFADQGRFATTAEIPTITTTDNSVGFDLATGLYT
ncbi:MAG: hypothetical protein Q9216_007082, partial [Gyalolechia sp. 2 TL-2023]